MNYVKANFYIGKDEEWRGFPDRILIMKLPYLENELSEDGLKEIRRYGKMLSENGKYSVKIEIENPNSILVSYPYKFSY